MVAQLSQHSHMHSLPLLTRITIAAFNLLTFIASVHAGVVEFRIPFPCTPDEVRFERRGVISCCQRCFQALQTVSENLRTWGIVLEFGKAHPPRCPDVLSIFLLVYVLAHAAAAVAAYELGPKEKCPNPFVREKLLIWSVRARSTSWDKSTWSPRCARR